MDVQNICTTCERTQNGEKPDCASDGITDCSGWAARRRKTDHSPFEDELGYEQKTE